MALGQQQKIHDDRTYCDNDVGQSTCDGWQTSLELAVQLSSTGADESVYQILGL